MAANFSAFSDELEKLAEKKKKHNPVPGALGGMVAVDASTKLMGGAALAGARRGHKSPPVKRMAKDMGIDIPFTAHTGRNPFGVDVEMGGHHVHQSGTNPWHYADPFTGKSTINSPKGMPEAFRAHELGHMKNHQSRLRISPRWARASTFGAIGARTVGTFSAGAAAAVAGGQEKPSYAPGLVNAAIHTPNLVEEARASGHALKYMVKRHGMLRGVGKSLRLLPAFGTYASVGLGPLGVTAFRKHRQAKKEKVE